MPDDPRDGRVLLTGATGFLGSHLGREMLRRGVPFSVLARSPRRAAFYLEQGVDVRLGDVTRPGDCRQALRGCRSLVHLAAAADVSDAAFNRAVNVDGLRHVLDACREEGVRRVVFLSSTCAGRPLRDAYGETKLEGESLVRESGLEATILRPTMIYGRGSKEFSTFVNVVRWSPVVPLVGDGRKVVQPVHVDDAVGAVLGCLTSAATVGGTYDVAGPAPVSFDGLVGLVRRTLGLGPRLVLHVPPAPVLLLARALGAVLTHVPVSVDQVLAFLQDTVVDIAPLRRDLGFAPRPLETGLAQVLRGGGP